MAAYGKYAASEELRMSISYHTNKKNGIKNEKNTRHSLNLSFNDATGTIENMKMALRLDSKTAFKLHVYPKAGYAGTISATVADGKGRMRTNVRKNDSDGSYYITVLDIAAHQLGSPLNIVITTDQGDVGVTASALCYAKTALGAALSGELTTEKKHMSEAMAAIYRYYKAADAYVH